ADCWLELQSRRCACSDTRSACACEVAGHGCIRAPRKPALHGVAQAGEVEVTYLEWRHYDRCTGAAVFTCAHPYRRTECLDIVEHEDWRLVVSEVLDRVRYLAVLDQESAVAREAREQNRALIDGTDIPETCDQDPALGARDHLRNR